MIEKFLSHQSKSFVTALGIIIVFIVGLIDYSTGPEIAFSIFYLLPISITAWYAGRRSGIAISFLSGVIWLAADIIDSHRYSNDLIQYWNASVRLGIFLVVAFLVSKMNEILQHEKTLARTDGLTGAVNGRYFYELLEAERRRAERYRRPFTVAYLDIDNFKPINDRHGHRTGDDLLQSVVKTVVLNLRSNDVVARLGGDEFALLLPETDYESAGVVFRKVREALRETMQKNEWPVTFSIGAITFLKSPAGVNEILHQADSLMYSVKTNGKNGIRHEILKDPMIQNEKKGPGPAGKPIT